MCTFLFLFPPQIKVHAWFSDGVFWPGHSSHLVPFLGRICLFSFSLFLVDFIFFCSLTLPCARLQFRQKIHACSCGWSYCSLTPRQAVIWNARVFVLMFWFCRVFLYSGLGEFIDRWYPFSAKGISGDIPGCCAHSTHLGYVLQTPVYHVGVYMCLVSYIGMSQ